MTVLGGYGFTHVGFGATRANVETVDLVVRSGRFLTSDIGRSWYRGRHGLFIELPVSFVSTPDVLSPMVGINFLANWTFTASRKIMPYIFAGGGLLYTDAEIPGLGSNLNGNYQSGGGFNYSINNSQYISVEYRLHHISNTGTKQPNDPLNSSKFLIGLTFYK